MSKQFKREVKDGKVRLVITEKVDHIREYDIQQLKDDVIAYKGRKLALLKKHKQQLSEVDKLIKDAEDHLQFAIDNKLDNS